jgi:hypothetical protein
MFSKKLAWTLVTLLLTSCFKPQEVGYKFVKDIDFDRQIVVGQSKTELLAITGSPSFTIHDDYFFVSLVTKQHPFLPKKILDSRYIIITFNAQNQVENKLVKPYKHDYVKQNN